jgi:hypothetical protein
MRTASAWSCRLVRTASRAGRPAAEGGAASREHMEIHVAFWREVSRMLDP